MDFYEDTTAIQQLIGRGLTKYWIAKKLGCAWNTVDMWSRGVWKPNKNYSDKLYQLWKSVKEGQEGKLLD